MGVRFLRQWMHEGTVFADVHGGRIRRDRRVLDQFQRRVAVEAMVRTAENPAACPGPAKSHRMHVRLDLLRQAPLVPVTDHGPHDRRPDPRFQKL